MLGRDPNAIKSNPLDCDTQNRNGIAVSKIDSFFSPGSVAVIGASATPGKPGRTVIENLKANGFKGEIHPVNPRGGKIIGLVVSKTIADLPHGIDMGIVMLPAAQTPQAIEDCAARGIQSVVLAAGGFAEVDQAGEGLQAKLRAVIKKTQVRVLGPNTAGHISTPSNFTSRKLELLKQKIFSAH